MISRNRMYSTREEHQTNYKEHFRKEMAKGGGVHEREAGGRKSHKRALSWSQVKAEERSMMMYAAEGTQETF